MLPRLAERFTCFLPDTPGLGESTWEDGADFSFAAQAERLRGFTRGLGLPRYSLLAFDTGATLAHQLALVDRDRVQRLVLLNTEIPGHRPPWIPRFQRALGWPGSRGAMALLLRSRTLRRSSLGFGGCFSDLSLLDGELHAGSIAPLLAEPRRLEDARRYLGGIDWALVDGLARRHAEIAAPVLFVWGEDDPTFPIERARPMAAQLRDCRGFVAVARAKLLVHEERPAEVLAAALPFLAE